MKNSPFGRLAANKVIVKKGKTRPELAAAFAKQQAYFDVAGPSGGKPGTIAVRAQYGPCVRIVSLVHANLSDPVGLREVRPLVAFTMRQEYDKITVFEYVIESGLSPVRCMVNGMNWEKYRSFAAAAALTLAASTAGAVPVEISKQEARVFGANNAAGVTITDDVLAPAGIWTRAGGFALTGGGLGDFVAWCLDISTYLNLASDYEVTEDSAGYTPFPNTTPLSLVQKASIQSLFDTAFSTLDLTTKADSGGFQLALWEVIFEGSGTFDIFTGDFSAIGREDARNRANQLLAGMTGPVTQAYRLTFLESAEWPFGGGEHYSQNLVTAAPIPLPAAGFLLVGALGGLAAVGRRRRPA